MEKPDCYKCIHRRDIPGNAHSECANRKAKVTGDKYGIRSGWFFWPYNFDPIWLESCTGFEKKEAISQAPAGIKLEVLWTKN